jgi:D-serine deaminase-like pyridoxal phosphate-dependent protein
MRLKVIVDNVDLAKALAGAPLDVLIEIDSDGHRAGLRPDDARLLEVARALAGGGATVAGVMTHAGASYSCASIAEIRAMAARERDAAVHAARRLRAAGFAAPVVSVGSTPTATYADELTGVTEVRAGVFVFFDLVMAGIDVCGTGDIALSVLATVIGHQEEKGWALIDAGWMALSRDRGTSRQRVDQGYGLVCDAAGKPIDDLIVVDANQEHGIVAHRSGDPAKLPEIPVGTLLRILPNHACATAAQHERYAVLDESGHIAAAWERFSGW